MAKISFNAIECKQNAYTFYMASIPKKTLTKITYIVRRRDNRKQGFQRFLNESRARAIAKYLDIDKGSIPAPIILSAQSNSSLKFSRGKISFENTKMSFLVLDGQHRLFGYDNTKKPYNIPVVVYSGLSIQQEVGLFIDINTNQKGVPSALLLDIKQIAGTETTTEEKQRIVFDKLNLNSPMAGLLSPDSSTRGRISRTAFNRATKTIFENGPFKDKSSDIIYKGFRNYLEASEITLDNSKQDSARLNKSLIFRALFNVFTDVVTKSLADFGDIKTDSIYSVLDPISIIRYDEYAGSSDATVNKLSAEMRNEMNKLTDINDDMF